jgi:hypothetical protein
MNRLLLSLILLITSVRLCSSQGTFQNLDFEAAEVTGYTPNYPIPTSSAFPNWQAIYGTTPTSQVSFDGISIGAAEISIVNDYPAFGLVPLQGNYSAYLFSAPSTTTTLSQSGLVPPGTQSIQMDIVERNGGSFTVALDGTTINMVRWQTLPNCTVYAGNVSAW